MTRPNDVHRIDLAVRLRPATHDPERSVEVRLTTGDRSSSVSLGGWLLPRPRNAWQLVAQLSTKSPLRAFVHMWRTQAPRMESLPLRRLVLQLDDARLAGLVWDWDFAIRPLLNPDEISVRLSPVTPRFRARHFTLPMRFVQVDPRPGEPGVADEVLAVFGNYSFEVIRPAVEIQACSAGDANDLQRRQPTLDVLHFDATDWPRDREVLLSLERWEQPGTLGWLLRLSTLGQTRLIVLKVKDPDQARDLRLLAESLVARGGPAVLLTPDTPAFFTTD